MIQEVTAETLLRRGTQGWLVGGTVRDRQLGRYSPDLDIVVDDDPKAVARDIAGALGSPWFALSTRHGAYRVMAPEGHIDVAGVHGSGIQEDLARRDFTVNAMAVSLHGGGLLDPFRGSAHLRAGLLVGVSGHIFEDDPLRLMRAVRFCHVLGMRLEPALERLVRRQASLVNAAASERILSEMALTLAEGRSAAAARLWADLGLLAVVVPEVGETCRFAALERLDGLLAVPRLVVAADRLGTIEARLGTPVDGALSRPVALRLAALLHQLTPEGVTRVGKRLKLSAPMLALLRAVCGCFASGSCAAEALSVAAGSGRSLVKFLWAAEPWEPEVLLVAGAMGSRSLSGPESAGEDEVACAALQPIRVLLAAWAERAARGVPPLPLNGNDLMQRLGLAPGPLLGSVLREVRLAWEAGEVSAVEELLELARRARSAGSG